MTYRRSLFTTTGILCVLAACSSPRTGEGERKAEPEPSAKSEPPAEPPKVEPPKTEPPAAAKQPPADPNVYRVKFETSKGDVIVEVHRDWAPLGAERFQQLVKDGFYDGARFFRVVPNFVIQFGLAAEPAKTEKWNKQIKDDPVTRTNGLGYLTFATAGPNTRDSQVFINLRSNQFLDDQGFAPFGRIVEGWAAVEKIYDGYREAPDQDQIRSKGNAYLNANFPKLDYIRKATVF